MKDSNNERFTSEVESRLNCYVYRLVDPRNGETFYVGKGTGNRVFTHSWLKDNENAEIEKIKVKRIQKIRLDGFDVIHIIHRHGLDEKTAFEVEAALIDAYPGLSNRVRGAGSNDRGVMHSKEIIKRYSAISADFKHPILLIKVKEKEIMKRGSAYEATHYAWKIKRSEAEKAKYVLACSNGLIIGAYVADKWLPATANNFPNRPGKSGRLGFVGREAPKEILEMYVGKRIPEKYRKRGAAVPFRYINYL